MNLVESLYAQSGAAEDGEFCPFARYVRGWDALIWVNADVSYRADRVDSFLTLFWHPQEERLVGIKLKGFRFIFTQVRDALRLREEDWIPLVKALEAALERDGENLREDCERKRLEGYKKATRFAQAAGIPPQEWKKAA